MNEPAPPIVDNVVGLPALPARPTHAHKGDFGRVLVVAGSPGLTGAGVLAARAALRAGAGLVTLAVPRTLEPCVAARLTSAMSLALPDRDGILETSALDFVLDAARRATVVALGPGLGRDERTGALVLALVRAVPIPLVVDADALVHLAADTTVLAARTAPTVLTPHPGEMAVLVGVSTAAVQAGRASWARDLARRTGAVVALKGAGTVVTAGGACYLNGTGNPGMATGGMGDVLTGIAAAFLAQRMAALDAARLAARDPRAASDVPALMVDESMIDDACFKRRSAKTDLELAMDAGLLPGHLDRRPHLRETLHDLGAELDRLGAGRMVRHTGGRLWTVE